MLKFNSGFATLPERTKLPQFSEVQIKNEPMMFSSSQQFALQNGGPITKAFFSLLPNLWRDECPELIFDSRVHMLMPGWYPCIPGWHHDDVPRTRADGQPNYINPEYRSQHFMALVGDCSVTSFLKGNLELEDSQEGNGSTYGIWHEEIEAQLKRGLVQSLAAPVGEMIYFTYKDFHKGNPATKNGWRWFGRASICTSRKQHNEIRRNAQVYLPAVNLGW